MVARTDGAARAMRDNGPGRVEYVVESLRPGGRETWLVMRADSSGARVVVDATSLRRVGLLEADAPAVPNRPAGFNPYFDPPAA